MTKPDVSRYANDELAVRFNSDVFPYLNGKVTNYAVIVCPIAAVSNQVLVWTFSTELLQQMLCFRCIPM